MVLPDLRCFTIYLITKSKHKNRYESCRAWTPVAMGKYEDHNTLVTLLPLSSFWRLAKTFGELGHGVKWEGHKRPRPSRHFCGLSTLAYWSASTASITTSPGFVLHVRMPPFGESRRQPVVYAARVLRCGDCVARLLFVYGYRNHRARRASLER